MQCLAAPADGPLFIGTAHDALFDISVEGRQAIAVGDFGLVVESNDGGIKWERNPGAFTDLGLFGVVRKNGKCIAVGQQGAVFRSADCNKWEAVSSGTDGRLLDVDVNSSGIAYAVGGFGALLRSTDWGASWQVLQPDWEKLSDGIEPHLYGVRVDEDGVVTVSGEFELIMRSSDGGTSWKALHMGEKSLFGLHLMSNGEGYAVGQEGIILKTDDNGHNWRELASPTQSILTAVWSSGEGEVLATGINTLLRSSDGGRSFQSDDSGLVKSGWLQATASSTQLDGSTKVFVVGSYAVIHALGLNKQ